MNTIRYLRSLYFLLCARYDWDKQWRGWLRHYATNRKVAGSILDGVSGIFH